MYCVISFDKHFYLCWVYAHFFKVVYLGLTHFRKLNFKKFERFLITLIWHYWLRSRSSNGFQSVILVLEPFWRHHLFKYWYTCMSVWFLKFLKKIFVQMYIYCTYILFTAKLWKMNDRNLNCFLGSKIIFKKGYTYNVEPTNYVVVSSHR